MSEILTPEQVAEMVAIHDSRCDSFGDLRPSIIYQCSNFLPALCVSHEALRAEIERLMKDCDDATLGFALGVKHMQGKLSAMTAENAEMRAAIRAIVEFCDDPNGSEKAETLAEGLARLLPGLRASIMHGKPTV